MLYVAAVQHTEYSLALVGQCMAISILYAVNVHNIDLFEHNMAISNVVNIYLGTI